jgi:uncharacterized protein
VAVTETDATVGAVRYRWATLLAVLATGACTNGDDSSSPPTAEAAASTSLSAASSTVPVVPLGFGTASVRVTSASGDVRELCLHLADTPELRAQGLMRVTDLGGLDGMLFDYTSPSEGSFWMKDTVMPLSIAFFGADGGFVSATDMDPCPPGEDCPWYDADGPFSAAIEVPQGGLAERGLEPGSTLTELGTPCA